MIKIMTTKKYELMQAELAGHKERTKIFDDLLKDKGMTLGDLVQNKAHLSWNPRRTPRVDVRAMMEKDGVAA